MAIERTALPVTILPEPNIVTNSLYETLEELGDALVRAVQKISTINLRKADAELLNMPKGSASLKIKRVAYLANGMASEFTL